MDTDTQNDTTVLSKPAEETKNSQQATTTQDESVVVSNEASSSRKKILVVDDEPDARELFGELLSTNSNYEVITAEDGVDALEKCSQTKFDLVLLDIVMPKMDGVDALTEIKKQPDKYGTPTVIMLTNIGGDIAVEKALSLGAVGFKLKIDTEPEELLRTVNDALNNQPIQNSVTNKLFN